MTTPSVASLPWTLPKSQAEWDAFIRQLSTWRPQPPAWQPLTLQNGWVAFGGAFASPAYQIDLNGRISLRGLIKSGTVTDATVITTLPYAPSFELVTSALGYSGTAYVPTRLDVDTSGNVAIYGAGGFAGAYFVSLDQVSFSLAR